MKARTPPFRTNPSTIARYFFHDCERFLYYSSASPQQRKKENLPAPEFERSPLIDAILHSGYRWEEEVVSRLLKGRVVVADGPGELHTRRLPSEQTVQCLHNEKANRFLYQPTISVPGGFYEKHSIDPALVAISDNHPDLVEILADEGGRRLFRVIDIKRGESLKLTHRAQILFYSLELQSILEAEGIDDARVDLDYGGVWLGKHETPDSFLVSDFRPHLERFLRRDLSRILAASAKEAHWHLYERCEWCEFFDHCREEMRRNDDVSQLTQLTIYGKRHLREEAGVRSLTQLGKFLKRSDADQVLDRCASLAGQRGRLQTRVVALSSRTPQLHGAASPDLPKGENLGVFLTLQKEPLAQVIYLAGVLVTGRQETRNRVFSPDVVQMLTSPEGKAAPKVFVAVSVADVPRVRKQFVLLLHSILQQVHQHNEQSSDWKDKLTLQAYVHTEDERALLFALLLEALQERELAEKAMTLLFHFQGPELMQADYHPGTEIPYPVVVLLNAVYRLLALPVEVSYTLPEMLEALGSRFNYSRKDYYHFPLGHGLRAESLHAAWYEGKKDNLLEIEQQAGLYLHALAALLRSIRDRASDQLFAWPAKFTLSSGAGIKDRLLSRLAFFARYESLLRCLAIRESRAEARPTQVLLGQVIELKARNTLELEVQGELIVAPEPGGFPQWLLVHDSDDGRRAQIEYSDYWYRSKPYGGPESPFRAVVGVENVQTDMEGRTILHIKYSRPFKDNEPGKGDRLLLYQRFTDFTTDAVVKFLEQLDRKGAELFLKLLRRPESAAEELPLPPKVGSFASKLVKGMHFTPSQEAAFEAMCRQRATAVWGPPGTGKTHFLATTILGLVDAHARAGLPFRVLVNAFTHSAIENLLRKLMQQRKEMSELKVSLNIAKVKYWQGSSAATDVVEEDELDYWLKGKQHIVLGATAYSCLKKMTELGRFDLVIVDEASQVRVPEAAVPCSLIAENGRLVLAGDHYQLPPIIAGVYPPAKPGEPLLHRSIFEAVVPRERTESKILRQLHENFRMNDVLTDVSGLLLYGPRYRCFDATTASRRLAFKAPRGLDDPMVVACLDPNYPLVLVVLDGIQAAQANPVEADLVAQLTVALRQGLRAADGKIYADDAAFFRRGVFVVSPHHAQIRAIQKELEKARTWDSPPFIDTVDKMQGQEADAVIVSYGVSDPEFAMREAEFIYGLNRLNVAITRARSKTIVCLPRPLLDATPQVLDVEAAAAGLSYMRRLTAILEKDGEVLEFEGEEVSAVVYRLGKTVVKVRE